MCNKDAPNEHNRLCSQRSVWDVILSSDDFNGLKPTAIQNLQPTFKVVQPKQSNQFVLVIDTSGSMASKVSFQKIFLEHFSIFKNVSKKLKINYLKSGHKLI